MVDNSELYHLQKMVFRVSKGMVHPVYVPLNRHVNLEKQIKEMTSISKIFIF